MPISAFRSLTLRPSAALDPATTAWVAAVVANGGSVSAGRQTVVNNLIVGLKAASLWTTKLDRLWLLAAENEPSARTDLVALSLATKVGSPPFTTDRGYKGGDTDPATDYIDTGYNATLHAVNFTQNAAHVSAWSDTNTASTVNGGGIIGNSNGGGASIWDTYVDGNMYGRINDSAPSQGSPSTRIGHWIITRDSNATTQFYQNATLFSSPNVGSAAIVNAKFAINAAAIAGLGNPNEITMASIGGTLSSGEVTSFYNLLRTYMTAVGVP